MARIGFVFDLDGTLLRSDGTLSPTTVAMLRMLDDLKIPMVVATARTPGLLGNVAGREAFGRTVCANGAVVWDARRDEVLWERCFDGPAFAAGLAQLQLALPDAGLGIQSARETFLDDTYIRLRESGSRGAERMGDAEAVLSRHGIVLAAIRHPRLNAEELLPTVTAAFKDVGIASSSGRAVDVVPLGTTKAGTVAGEMAELGCVAEAVVAFGDMPNDLPLFAWAGRACAVANAHPSVRDAADEVVPANDDDGVALTVQRLMAATL